MPIWASSEPLPLGPVTSASRLPSQSLSLHNKAADKSAASIEKMVERANRRVAKGTEGYD
jgi:hypothetical protein